jgi:hypothetical protein
MIDKSNVVVSQYNDATTQGDWATFSLSNKTSINLSSRAMLYSMRLSIGQKNTAFN